MLGALCGGIRQCIVDIWNTCEQLPVCVHEIWHQRRREGEISDFEVAVGQAIAQELGRTQSPGNPGQGPEPAAPEEQPDQALVNSTQHGESCSDYLHPFPCCTVPALSPGSANSSACLLGARPSNRGKGVVLAEDCVPQAQTRQQWRTLGMRPWRRARCL